MADKVKAFFSRVTPFHLIPGDNMTDHEGFDAYPVEVDPRALQMAVELRFLATNMKELFDNMPAPEDACQAEADVYAEELSAIVDGFANG